MATFAVIGAGLAGLVLSRELARSHDVVVFEKSRGVGGRMATRRAGHFAFDHGAQFFTARSDAFQAFIDPFLSAGIVADWMAPFAELQRDRIITSRRWDSGNPHYVGVPSMNAVARHLASDLDIRRETAVRSLARSGARWQLIGDEQRLLGEFDWVVVTAPAVQAAELLAATSIASAPTGVRMQACYALLLGFDKPVDLPWHAALVHDADISWISVNSSKPGRPEPFSLVVHSTNAWADAHVDDEAGAVRSHLADEVGAVTGVDVASAAFCDLHRWRYANADRQDGDLYALDPDQRLAACGDWFVRGRVEGAFSSASALAAKIGDMLDDSDCIRPVRAK
jgi:renalase